VGATRHKFGAYSVSCRQGHEAAAAAAAEASVVQRRAGAAAR